MPYSNFFAPPLLREIRSRFHHVDHCPITTARRIFLENGGGSLKLKAALDRAAEISALPDQEARDNPASRHLSAVREWGVADLRLMMGAANDDGSQIISGETGTRLLYRFVRAVALAAAPGPFISCTIEHPATLNAARQWAENTGRPWREVPFTPASGTVTPADYAAVVEADTQLATISHTSQLTGFQVDLRGIVQAIRATAPDCFIIVDGIQYAPHGVMAVNEYGADAYVFSPYKAYSRLAAGFGWVNARLSALPHEHMPGKSSAGWELGSRDLAIYGAQSEIVRYLEWLGSHFEADDDPRERITAAGKAMAAHESALVDLLLHGDSDVAGLTQREAISLVGPPQLEDRQGIVSFNLAGMESPQLVRQLADHHIRVHARTRDPYSRHILEALDLPDCLRVSLCHYNSPEEIRALLLALDQIQQ